jgi:hypothetical protein
MVQPEGPECMRFARCITKATDTHSEQVILIAFAWNKRVMLTSLKLRLYVHCLSCYTA